MISVRRSTKLTMSINFQDFFTLFIWQYLVVPRHWPWFHTFSHSHPDLFRPKFFSGSVLTDERKKTAIKKLFQKGGTFPMDSPISIVLPQIDINCWIWQWLDYSLYTAVAVYMMCISLERYLLIFHDGLYRTTKRRLLLHYVPLV